MDSDTRRGIFGSGWIGPLAVFGVVWAGAMAYLLLNGFTGQATSGAIISGGVVLLGATTFWILPEGYAAPQMPRAWIAVLIASVFILLSGLDGLAFHSIMAHPVPAWDAFRGWLSELGTRWFGFGAFLANPAIYFMLPMAALAIAGVQPAEAGLRWGRNTLPATIVWGLPMALMIALPVIQGEKSAELVRSALVSNGLQNGFFEEFLFRGALQMALAGLIAGPRAATIAAVVFGLWHIGLDVKVAGGDWFAGLASTIVIQAPLGLGLALLAERTGSLIAPSIAHVLMNSAG